MATTKNITMKQFNGTDYDTLYPKTVAAQIDDVYSKNETYPKSQLYTQSQLYTRQQILSDATKTLYGLGSSAIPDDVFSWIAQETSKIATGSYVGTGTYGSNNPNSLTFDFVPKAVFMIGTKDSDGVHHAYMFGYDSGGNGLSQHTAMYYELLTTNYVESVGFGMPYGSGKSNFGKRSNDGKTFSWYADYSSSYQFNDAGTTYYYMAIY